MASPIPKLLLLFSILSFISLSASARPCKTLFISSYSFSIKPLYPKPNSNFDRRSSSGFVTIVTEITQQHSSSEIFLDRPVFPAVDHYDTSEPQGIQRRQEGPVLPFGISSYDMSSLRDRTKDILSVVVALLFGVGCGALTAATMYLVWSLFSTRYDYRYEEFDGEDVDEADDVSPKKMGYVKIPEAVSMPKQVKEVV
ncbi:uncharacterized protein LOC110605036 [Manihot esculenta]|uniref:Transmembrane protein n=1 Tax=Manihot esculenta TaxID=3983 RepID=A0A2C9WBZ6_MANES|nr:uncharacterized protein LOC110605036 [Manihot esculenta]OAY57257.1 hypothetical protein MANES_02G082600v8 [Manihot esculenta]